MGGKGGKVWGTVKALRTSKTALIAMPAFAWLSSYGGGKWKSVGNSEGLEDLEDGLDCNACVFLVVVLVWGGSVEKFGIWGGTI